MQNRFVFVAARFKMLRADRDMFANLEKYVSVSNRSANGLSTRIWIFPLQKMPCGYEEIVCDVCVVRLFNKFGEFGLQLLKEIRCASDSEYALHSRPLVLRNT